jgi:hypothetical protein
MQVGNEPSAEILRFPRRRGRPRTLRVEKDKGTPELIRKKQVGETSEILDLCLERRLITPEQHWCGIHLRWLYTLRYGIPTIRAIDPTHLGGIDIKSNDQQWRIQREKEYSDAIMQLNKSGYTSLVMSICIYNERPSPMTPSKLNRAKQSGKSAAFINALAEGLDILHEHWKTETAQKNT